jgi:hypothetical protein
MCARYKKYKTPQVKHAASRQFKNKARQAVKRVYFNILVGYPLTCG